MIIIKQLLKFHYIFTKKVVSFFKNTTLDAGNISIIHCGVTIFLHYYVTAFLWDAAFFVCTLKIILMSPPKLNAYAVYVFFQNNQRIAHALFRLIMNKKISLVHKSSQLKKLFS